ncbi:SprT-like family protein [Ekhidna lutea]|uniref:SprT-like family protein n=1 Tax=Ekhidna lutea TaxID=447679 RepID=A0A239JZJ7_EKHLU|nr:SprT-like domain-containing protein [Ekhidna lutea]SNT11240.1 SprT-like family protein [Ekhidna lutea]
MTSREVFQKFVPEASVSYCVKLYEQLGFEFKIKKARQTKLGDYRFNPKSDRHTITVNNDLNPFAFLVTYLHEVAHLLAFKQYGRRIQPHGKEWKRCFKEVSQPMLKTEVFHSSVLNALKNYFKNPKASSCSDPVLYQILKEFDADNGKLLLKEIQTGQTFTFNKKAFIKLEKKRTRAVCQEVVTHRKYLISELAEVFLLDQQKND